MWRDWALVGAVVVGAVLEVALREDLPLPWLSLAGDGGAGADAAVAAYAPVRGGRGGLRRVRRSWTSALIIADEPALDMYTMIYFLVLPYALFRWASGREVLAGLAIILVAATTGVLRELDRGRGPDRRDGRADDLDGARRGRALPARRTGAAGSSR